MNKKVIIAGHICLDITPLFPPEKGGKISDIMLPGKLIEMEGVNVHTGGTVANTGLAMKILGMDVSLMGKVGNDAFGEMVLNILDKYGAKTGMIVADNESTSYSVVLAMPGIDRIFLHNPGANSTFCSADIPEKELAGASLLHFGYPPLMKAMYENEGKELVCLMKKAKDNGVATSLDMAAVDENSEAGKADWNTILQNVIPYVDFFVPSVEELCFMLDKERFKDWFDRADGRDITEILDIDKDVKPLADICMAYGAKILLIKCGAAGMYYRTGDVEVLRSVGKKAGLNPNLWSNKEGFERSYIPERILSGTGAGDTSIAAFLAAMLEGCPIEEAMHLATAEGASCVASFDALGGIKPLDELRQRIEAGWKKYDD